MKLDTHIDTHRYDYLSSKAHLFWCLPPLPHPHHSALVDWLSVSLLNWVVIQLRSSAGVLLPGGETDHSMHAWIYYFCYCHYPWQGYGIRDLRPVAYLASELSLSLPHNKAGLNVSCEGFNSDNMLLHLQRITDVSHRGRGREAYMMKQSQNWNWLAKAFYKTKTILLWIQLWSTDSVTGTVRTDHLFSATDCIQCWWIYYTVKSPLNRAVAISAFLWSSAFGPLDLGQCPRWL